MNIHSLYSKVRRPLAVLCMFVFVVTVFFGMLFGNMLPREERAGVFILYLLLFILWTYATSIGRLLTYFEHERRYRWVNIFSMIFFVCVCLYGTILPQAPVRSYEGSYITLNNIFGIAAIFWAYLSVALDLGEIFL